jgi:beta-galactosidase
MLKGVAPALPTHRSGRSWRLVTRSASVSFLRLSCGSVWPLIAAAVGLLLVISGNARGETNDHMYAPQAAAAPYINFDNEGYIINGQRTWVASGDIHYPRVPEELWLDRLLRLKRCGLNTVQTYAFMNYHCMGSGTYNFTGQADLNQYLQDINSLGLYALVRAGMYVCSEWDNGGYPQFMMLEPGLSLRTSNTPQYLAVSDQWYAQVIPIIAANQINKGGAVLWVQLDNEHPSCWGVDYDNLTYFQHLLSMALADGIQVPMYFSGLHHSSDPAGTSSWNSVGREDPWFADEFWAGWFSYYGNSGGDLTTVDRGTWKIIAYGGNGYDYYMFHGGSNWDHWPAGGIGASYDYGAAVGEAGDLRTMYYRDKRAAIFAHSFQSILEQSTNADASYAGAATGTTAINARTSPAGTIVFLDNDTANTVTATLADGAQMQLEAYEIGNVVENFALAPWIMIDECDERIFGIQPQGAYTTLVLYGLPGDIAQSHFGLTSGTVSQADPEFTVSGTNVSFSAPVAAGTTASYQLTSGTNTLRVLVMSKPVVDRTWFVSSSGSNYVVNGPDYVGNFTNPNGQVNCTLEEPLGNPLPTTILSYGPDQYAPHPLTISSPVANGTPAAPTLTNWQMRSGTGEAAVGYNDSAWYTTATPQLMGSDGDTSNYAWYRAEPVIATSGTYYLATPAIYDSGQLYVNGTLAPVQPSVSGTCVPIALQSGTNTVAFFTAHYGRESFYEVTGTSASGFSPKGLQGGVGIGATPLTNWYWWNTGTNAVPTSGTLAAVTATTFNPAANGWSTGAGWNKNVLTGAGYAFFRTTLPNLPGPQTVYFTNVADNCTVYLNGTNVVGSNNGAATPFTVSLSSYWSTSGTNVLTVLVRDVGAADGSAECGLNGGVLMNPLSTAIPNWKLQGGLGTIEGPNVTWGAVGTTGSTPTFYHATFNYQPSSGILPILRAGYAGLTSGHIWLNGHPLGRYPQVIPITGIYLPECWLSAANTIDYFDENGAAPTSTSLFVETGASREVYQAQDIDGAMIYPPETFSAAGGNGEVTLSWSAVAGATGYNVKRSTTSGGPYTTIGSNVSALTFLDSGVNNGITYYYVVSGTNASGETAPSAEESATPAYIVPTVANPSFELPGTGKISSGFSTVPGWANAGSTYANSGVENSPASYAGSWHAFCKGSDSGAYQMLGYQMQAGDSITLTWWAEHTGGSGASGQIVSLLSGASQTAPYSSTTILSTTNGALNGYGSTSGPWTQYTLTYTAAAADAGNYIGIFFNNNSTSNWSGFDDFSISVASLPYPPTGLTALDQTTSVALNWYPVVTAASYNLKRGIVSGTYNTTVAVSGTNYTDSGVTQGTTYYYAVSGVNNVGEGSNSIPVSVTPSPPISIAEQMYSNAFIPPGTSGSNGTVVFRSSVTGHTYTLQWSPDISKGVWTAIGNPMTGTGGNLEFPPVSLTGTMGFYRILIQRQ